MRGKRSKQYRKLMQQYSLHFGFREPYQVLIDGAILEDAARFKMDFVSGLSKALHGQIKPMLTTCSIRHLSQRNDQHSTVMDHAREFERRRCNHHTLEDPLSEFACIQSVVDPKGTKNNKHKLVVASQDDKLRTMLRGIPGVPLIYIKRSVMVMEPMGGATERVRETDERGKFRAGLKGARGGEAAVMPSLKRKREVVDNEEASGGDSDDVGGPEASSETQPVKRERKRQKGPKGPNPLSTKKPKSKTTAKVGARSNGSTPLTAGSNDQVVKQKRKRRHKTGQPDLAGAPPPTINAAIT